MEHDLLSAGCVVFERGWLSSNNIVFAQGKRSAVVDTGYCSHSVQTLALVRAALGERELDLIANTHLHSDHCGGNAQLQSYFPNARLAIPPGQASNVAAWDEVALSYVPTGQSCPKFSYHDTLNPGSSVLLGDLNWEVHAAPGHDPQSVVLFEPSTRTLISADALWGHGFGVVFEELDSSNAFDEVAQTLDLIDGLHPVTVIPGHGPVFSDVSAAVLRARTRLDQFVRNPVRHATYGAKVLIKYKFLEWQSCADLRLREWVQSTPLFARIHSRFFSDQPFSVWLDSLLAELVRSSALEAADGSWFNRE